MAQRVDRRGPLGIDRLGRASVFAGPADKLEAAHGLPLGIANKLMLELSRTAGLAARRPCLLPARPASGPAAYHLRPLGRPTVEGYFGGALARELEQGGLAAFEAFALDELVGLFGSDIRAKLRPIVSTAWHSDPFSLGSYSHALPGHADDRARLAAPVDERLSLCRRGLLARMIFRPPTAPI